MGISDVEFKLGCDDYKLSIYTLHCICQANDARKELYEKEKEIHDLKQEGLGLKQALKDANDQCVLLFNEVKKAWKVSSALQTDLKVWQFNELDIVFQFYAVTGYRWLNKFVFEILHGGLY